MSAILRDTRTAELVNLCDRPKRFDLYMVTGTVTEGLIRAAKGSEGFGECLPPMVDFGIPRGLVKRPTMTLPYGLTQRSVAGYLYSDYLAKTDIPGLDDSMKFKTAVQLTPYVWEALKDTQKATMEVLQWLRGAIGELQGRGASTRIEWKTPDGFLAQQFAAEYDESRIRTWCGSPISIRWSEQGIEPSPRRHRTAFPPNFIHSMDATHLRELTRRLKAAGCDSFAMIHDDFGVPVGFSDTSWRITRESFRDQYLGNMMTFLREQWDLGLEELPQGDWDPNEVVRARFAFK